jgi:RNA polymerase sigma-70 factor, ECF subfamily
VSNLRGGESVAKTTKLNAGVEQSLIDRARRGSSEAFAELAQNHSQTIYGISWRMFRNTADAEDNVQDTLYRAYANIRRFEGRSRFSTWLVRIAINEALMTMRRRRQENVTLEGDLPISKDDDRKVLDIEDDDPGQERSYIARELTGKAFDGLHPSTINIFIHSAEGWTQRELAQESGMSIAAIKSRIFHARRRMNFRLEDLF